MNILLEKHNMLYIFQTTWYSEEAYNSLDQLCATLIFLSTAFSIDPSSTNSLEFFIFTEK